MRRATLLALAALLLAGEAVAHRLRVFATTDGETISGHAYFVGGGRPDGASVRVEGPDGAPLGAAVTDAEGRFAFAPRLRVRHTLVIDVGDGHVAEATIEAESLAESLPALRVAQATATTASAEEIARAVERAVARQVAPLAERIDALEAKLRLQDILGGLGFVAGLAGLWLWMTARGKGGAR